MNQEACTHYWVINHLNIGQCYKCGARKDFRELQLAQENRLNKKPRRPK